MKKIHVSSQFRPHGAQTIIFLGDISAVTGLKIEKVGPSFSSFNPCPSLSFIATGDRKQSQCLNKVLLHFSKTCKFWCSKANRHLHFSLPSIILADVWRNRTWRVQKVVVCDWLFSIRFVRFCGSRLIACDCNYDWRQQKTQLWRRIFNLRVGVLCEKWSKWQNWTIISEIQFTPRHILSLSKNKI